MTFFLQWYAIFRSACYHTVLGYNQLQRRPDYYPLQNPQQADCNKCSRIHKSITSAPLSYSGCSSVASQASTVHNVLNPQNSEVWHRCLTKQYTFSTQCLPASKYHPDRSLSTVSNIHNVPRHEKLKKLVRVCYLGEIVNYVCKCLPVYIVISLSHLLPPI